MLNPSPFLKATLVVILIAILLRGLLFPAVVLHPDRLFDRDSASYVQPAVNILDGHGFSQAEEPPFTPDTSRTPVYPLFIAALFGIFGKHPLVIATAQALISALTCGLTYILGLQLFPERAARWGGLLLAFSLGSIVYSFYILTETLFTLLLLGVGCALVAYQKHAQGRWLVVGGLLAGTATLCRPIALLYPLAIAPLIGFVDRVRTGELPGTRWRHIAMPALAFLGAAGLVIVPWSVRNYRLLGFASLSTIANYNLLFYNAVSLEADLRGMGQDDMRALMAEQVETELARRGVFDDAGRAAVYDEWGRQIILKHPLRYLRVHLRNDLNSLLPNVTEFLELLGITRGGKGTLSVLNQYGVRAAVRHYFGGQMWLLWLLAPLVALLGLTYLGMLAGVTALIQQRSWSSLALLLLPITYFLLIPGAPSHPRFRVPVMPYICLLAGNGIVATWRLAPKGSLSLRRVKT